MKTVSTKLTKEDFERFQEMCNYEDQCMSKQLRDLIKTGIDACEYYREYGKEKSESKDNIKPIIEVPKVPTPVAHGKILDDDGNIIGTF